MSLRDTKYVSLFCLCGIAAGMTICMYIRRRRKAHSIDYVEKTSNSECEETEQKSFTIPDDCGISDQVNEEEMSPASTDSYHSFSTDSSASSSMVTCSSSNSVSDTSDDERQKSKKNNLICGVNIEDESYHDDEIPKEFEMQLGSPIVATLTNIQLGMKMQTVSEDTHTNIVPNYYSDSTQTILQNMDLYNIVNQPNSPLTAWYVK